MIGGRVLVHASLPVVGHHLQRLRLRQSLVHLLLVVLNELKFSDILAIEMVLTVAEGILALHHGGGVAGATLAKLVVALIILTQIVVESSLAMTRLVHCAQPTGAIRDVCVTSAAVVSVCHTLGVDMRHEITRPLFARHEGSCIKNR